MPRINLMVAVAAMCLLLAGSSASAQQGTTPQPPPTGQEGTAAAPGNPLDRKVSKGLPRQKAAAALKRQRLIEAMRVNAARREAQATEQEKQ